MHTAGIAYRGSPASESLPGLPDTAPRAGDRFPWLRLMLQPNTAVEDLFARLDDTRFSLLLFGQPLPAEGPSALGDLLQLYAVPDDPANDRELARVKVPKTAFYLLRPDGHVGLAGTHYDPEAATRYLSGRMHLTGG